MKRNRLTWNTPETNLGQKRASRMKYADPYTMNQDRENPPAEAYMIGDPAAWAEDPMEVSDLDGTDRDDLGLPVSHEDDPAEWNDGEYANSDTFGPGDALEGRNASHGARLANLRRHLEKKAFQCLRIASAMLPEAGEDEQGEQALSLMDLPDEAVTATVNRIDAYLSRKAGGDAEDEVEEDEVEAKTASLSSEEMLRVMIAEETEEDEDGTDKAATIRELIAMEVAKVLGIKSSGDESGEADSEDEADEEDSEVEEDEAKEASFKSADGMSDEDIDSMLDELEGDADDELMLDPVMDGFDMEDADDDLDLFSESDAVLEALMQRSAKAKPAKTASSKGIKQLGRVKEAATTEDDLSKLWGFAPDVSKIFGK